jgi:hypothetical protein
MATHYRPAPQVAELVGQLVDDTHRDLEPVRDRIICVFRDPPGRSAGRQEWGRARKVSGLNAFLIARVPDDEIPDEEADFSVFVIEIALEVWAKLDEASRAALVDHELCHCVLDEDDNGDLVLTIVGHDIEEFHGVLSRHGLWREDVERFIRTGADQLSMGV